MSRTAIAVLSTENLIHNFKIIQAFVKPAKIIGMIKANAYGHGLRSTGLRLDDYVDLLGVASIDEAIALRKAGVKAPIVLMQGIFEQSELLIASTEGFHIVFNNAVQIDWFLKATLPLPLETWIKIDTGMGRLGFTLEDGKKAYDKLMNHKNALTPVRVMSHFACADEKDHPLNQKQIAAFNDFKKDISSEFSLCNSAGIFNFPECHFDYVRPGLTLYGVNPIQKDLGLKPVMTLQTSLVSVEKRTKGSSIGYGARYSCPETMPVGIAAFGYGDGYPLSARDGTPVLVNNRECPIIGRVSMDMIAIDLRNFPQANVGDPVVFWGDGLPIEQVAEHTSNLTYDMLTGVQNRVKFYWTRQS